MKKKNTKIISKSLILHWSDYSSGGGDEQYSDFISVLADKGKIYNRGLEWCAGHGAIGFSVIDSGFCKSFAFMDLYEPGIKDIEYTATVNNLQDHIKTYLMDLIVANPPHCFNDDDINIIDVNDPWELRLTVDKDWEIHNKFFESIGSYLKPNADIFLSEIDKFPEHITVAEKNGLTFMGSYPAPKLAEVGGENSIIMHYRYET
jgi:methylase of polypeptide subunit release factors